MPDDRATEAWRQVRSRVGTFDQATSALIGLVRRNLPHLDLDAADAAMIRSFYLAVRARQQLWFPRWAAVLVGLTDAGISTLVLKGAALGSLHYGDPALRPMADFDVLVPEHQWDDAARVLREHGLHRTENTAAQHLKVGHARPFTHSDGWQVDLHRYVHFALTGGRNGSVVTGHSQDEFWARSVAMSFLGVETRSLDPTDLLLHVCVHGASPRWLADAWIIIEGSPIEWGRLVDEADRHRVVLPLSQTLAALRRFGSPVDVDALGHLGRRRVTPRDHLVHHVRTTSEPRHSRVNGPWLALRRYTHVSADQSLRTAVAGYPDFLRASWQVAPGDPITRSALRRLGRR